ncbi:ATP-binding protein [Streptomyces sp. 35G-GA-8]|uniref:ATP-binding protein n=1 Tax=Streptomyces sp. 35G-GA-8 TaxID=2939434 RepID=UPI00201EF399|nr:ATP-binding protein [Streptomyces sp. 35G-GA-8]MCL7375496.1 ATP-binding protein [Streptomyces sp. 35G-GA-8]
MSGVRLLGAVPARGTAWVARQTSRDDRSSRGGSSPDAQAARNTRRISLSLDRSDDSCRRARQWARAALADWSHADRDDIVDDTLLVVSELVANAVLHACGPIRAHLERRPDGSVHIAVDDGGPAESSRPHELAGDHGRGLDVISALAADHGRTTALPCPYRARSWATLTTGHR